MSPLFEKTLEHMRAAHLKLGNAIQALEQLDNLEASDAPAPSPTPATPTAPIKRMAKRTVSVRQSIEKNAGLTDKIRSWAKNKTDGFTVKEASEALGADSNSIAKTMFFLVRRNEFVKTGQATYSARKSTAQAYADFKATLPQTQQEGV